MSEKYLAERRPMNLFTPHRVLLDLTREQYSELMLLLGYGIAAAREDGYPMARSLKLANALNESSTPYAIPEEPAAKP